MFIPTKAKNALIAQTFLNDYVMTTEFMDAMYAADPRPPAWTESADKVTADPITQGLHRLRQAGHPAAGRARDGFGLGVPGPGRVQGRVG